MRHRFVFIHAAASIFWLCLALLPATSFCQTEPPKKQLRAGAATSNITPPLGVSINGSFQDAKAAYIHDELHARCLVLDNGDTRIAFVVVDSCLIPREIFDDAKRMIQEQTGLPPDHVLISSTHTHSAPSSVSIYQSEAVKDYLPFLKMRIVDTVRRAIHNLAPARIAWGAASESNQVFNRRWKMKPGAMLANPFGGTDQVRMNPPPGNPALLEPAGPTDPEVTFISVQFTNGRPMALLANYSLHYVGGVPADEISADYCGAFADRIQQLLGADHQGPEFVGIMCNGTSGDVNNTNFRKAHGDTPPYAQIRTVANIIATDVQRVCRTLSYHDWVPCASSKQKSRSACVAPMPPKSIARKNSRGLRPQKSEGYKEIYAHETLYLKDYPVEVPLIIQAIRIGDLGIAAIPCEVFAQIGLDIKAQSPFKPTFTISLANGWNGYLPTPERSINSAATKYVAFPRQLSRNQRLHQNFQHGDGAIRKAEVVRVFILSNRSIGP